MAAAAAVEETSWLIGDLLKAFKNDFKSMENTHTWLINTIEGYEKVCENLKKDCDHVQQHAQDLEEEIEEFLEDGMSDFSDKGYAIRDSQLALFNSKIELIKQAFAEEQKNCMILLTNCNRVEINSILK
jgi:predicted RNase H-like nuclease (RuvC/YqgF family)